MNIYSTLQIGDYHTHHCEDDLLIKKINSDKMVCAVMDGCSTAMDSHFASTLVGKILRKIIIEKGYKALYEKDLQRNLDEELKTIIKDLFDELLFVKNHLMLDEKELLTTLIILIYDSKIDKGIILTIGDGVICINGNLTEFDRDNKPDYIAYHLHKNFDDWYATQQKVFFDCLNDISIATDGILSFLKVKKTFASDEIINCAEFLMINQQNKETEEMLNRKIKQLEHQYGVKASDDLAMIRIIK